MGVRKPTPIFYFIRVKWLEETASFGLDTRTYTYVLVQVYALKEHSGLLDHHSQ